MNLNEAQKKLATTIEGPVIASSCAGSGKTTAVISRLIFMLKSGIKPENILMLTFTNKAANNMVAKASATGLDVQGLTACTYHSFCAKLLRRYGDKIGIRRDFSILSTSNCNVAIGLCKDKVKFPKVKGTPSNAVILGIISKARTKGISLTKAIDRYYPYYEDYIDNIIDVADEYQKYKTEQNILDYEDLLYCVLNLLRENDDLCHWLSDKYKYIIVDEYQDTSTVQLEILKELRKYDNKNVCVVGDGMQSIFAFINARVENITEFPTVFPNTAEIPLTYNYRSNQEILDLANAVAERTPVLTYHDMVGTHSSGYKPIAKTFYSQEEEAIYVYEEIQRLTETIPLNDIAVLVRNSFASTRLETILNRMRIPYKKYGGIKFLEREAPQDVFAFLHILCNTNTEIYWLRFLQLYMNIGPVNAQRIAKDIFKMGIEDFNLKKYEKRIYYKYLLEFVEKVKEGKQIVKEKRVSDAIDFAVDYYYELKQKKLLDKSDDYAKDISNLDAECEQLRALKNNKYQSLKSFLDDMTLDNADEDEEDGLTISTVHSAKGLEWDVVFLLDVDDQNYPGEKPISSYLPDVIKEHENEIEEGRRLLYVAITRAKEHLYVLRSEKDIRWAPTEPSRFLPNKIIRSYCEC